MLSRIDKLSAVILAASVIGVVAAACTEPKKAPADAFAAEAVTFIEEAAETPEDGEIQSEEECYESQTETETAVEGTEDVVGEKTLAEEGLEDLGELESEDATSVEAETPAVHQKDAEPEPSHGGVESTDVTGGSDDRVRRTVLTVNGAYAGDEVYGYLKQSLEAHGIGGWLPYALAQAYQESRFNPAALNPHNGLDTGLFQFRSTYWRQEYGDIWDYRSQIDRYVSLVEPRIRSGLSVEETISRHYTSDYLPEVNWTYVNDVLKWINTIQEVTIQ